MLASVKWKFFSSLYFWSLAHFFHSKPNKEKCFVYSAAKSSHLEFTVNCTHPDQDLHKGTRKSRLHDLSIAFDFLSIGHTPSPFTLSPWAHCINGREIYHTYATFDLYFFSWMHLAYENVGIWIGFAYHGTSRVHAIVQLTWHARTWSRWRKKSRKQSRPEIENMRISTKFVNWIVVVSPSLQWIFFSLLSFQVTVCIPKSCIVS